MINTENYKQNANYVSLALRPLELYSLSINLHQYTYIYRNKTLNTKVSPLFPIIIWVLIYLWNTTQCNIAS